MCITKLLYRTTRFNDSYITYRRRRIRVQIADTPRRMMLGLMHRERIGHNEGMLFMPGTESRHGIWMLNMRFSIDILWLSGNGTVVDMVENAKPCASIFNCKTYRPARPCSFVLELASGGAERLGIKRGAVLDLKCQNI